MSGTKLRSEKKLDENQGRSDETGEASETLMYPFEEGEQTLIRPDNHPRADLEGQARTLNGRKLKNGGGLGAVRGQTERRNFVQGNVQIRDQE